MMLSRETTAGIACSFLVTYYREFVKEREFTGLLDLYSDASQLTYANYNEEKPDLAQGRHEIAQHLAKLDAVLGRRKVEVRFVDFTPLPNSCLHIVCQGIMYLRGRRLAFFQVFVLAPTQHRTNTYHIASDYFRVMATEVEHVPEDSIVMTPAEVAQHLLQDHERRQRAEERRERQRRAAEEALWQRRAAEEAERRREQQTARAGEQQETRRRRGERQNNSGNYNNSANASNHNNSRENFAGRKDDRRGEQEEVVRADRTGRGDNNRPSRAEPKSLSRGGRQGERRAEHNRNVRPQEEQRAAAAAPEATTTTKSTYPSGARERPNAAPAPAEGASSNTKSNVNNNRPVPRSKAALEKQGEKREENNSARRQRTAGAAPAATTATSSPAAPLPRSTPATETTTTTAAAAAAAGEPADKGGRSSKQRNVKKRADETDFVRLVRVPKNVKLSDIKAAVKLELGAEPLDAHWFGHSSADCVLKLRSAGEVQQMLRGPMTVLDEKLKVLEFFP